MATYDTTSANVVKICELDSGDSFDEFVAIANAIVYDALDATTALDNVRKELIARYLAAHFYRIYKPEASTERAGPVGETSATKAKVGEGFALTRFGQMAMSLDTTGTLRRMNEGKQVTVGLTWLGMTTTTPGY